MIHIASTVRSAYRDDFKDLAVTQFVYRGLKLGHRPLAIEDLSLFDPA
jgi:hypothetical protein